MNWFNRSMLKALGSDELSGSELRKVLFDTGIDITTLKFRRQMADMVDQNLVKCVKRLATAQAVKYDDGEKALVYGPKEKLEIEFYQATELGKKALCNFKSVRKP